jgi:hypothetical protein
VLYTQFLACFSHLIDVPSVSVQATYLSKFTTNSPKYSPTIDCDSSMPSSYYEAIQVNVIEDGHYSFATDNRSIYTYIYKDEFNPLHEYMNLHNNINEPRGKGWVKPTLLQKNTTYILVVITLSFDIIGTFSIIGEGLNNMIFKYLSE